MLTQVVCQGLIYYIFLYFWLGNIVIFHTSTKFTSISGKFVQGEILEIVM